MFPKEFNDNRIGVVRQVPRTHTTQGAAVYFSLYAGGRSSPSASFSSFLCTPVWFFALLRPLQSVQFSQLVQSVQLVLLRPPVHPVQFVLFRSLVQSLQDVQFWQLVQSVVVSAGDDAGF